MSRLSQALLVGTIKLKTGPLPIEIRKEDCFDVLHSKSTKVLNKLFFPGQLFELTTAESSLVQI